MTIATDPTRLLKSQLQPQADVIIFHKEVVTISSLSAYFLPIAKDPEGLHAVPSIEASMFHRLCRDFLIKPITEDKGIRFFNGEPCVVSLMPYESGSLIDGIKIQFAAGEGPISVIADTEHVDRARKYVTPDGYESYQHFLTTLQAKALSFALAKNLGTLPADGTDVDITVNLVRDSAGRDNRVSSLALANRSLNFGEGGSIAAFFKKAGEFLATPEADFVQKLMHIGHAERVQAIRDAAARKAQPSVVPA